MPVSSRKNLYSVVAIATLMILLSTFVSGCGRPLTPGAQRLRITNRGTVPLEDLVVLFPEERIEFGDVAPGATTEYVEVPEGVYGYAAYEYDLNGERVTQPVLDWMGEEPREGVDFTYVLEYDPGRPPLQRIQLREVVQDE